jgi:hypothetical protein
MFLDPSAKLLTQKRTHTFDREQEHDGGANGKNKAKQRTMSCLQNLEIYSIQL